MHLFTTALIVRLLCDRSGQMTVVVVLILLATRRSWMFHDSHVLYQGMSSAESYFWHSSVTIFPICLRKGLISSKPRTRGVDLVFRRVCASLWVRGVVMTGSRDGSIGPLVGVDVIALYCLLSDRVRSLYVLYGTFFVSIAWDYGDMYRLGCSSKGS